MTLQGRVENGVVVFQCDAGQAPLPEGTLVKITPLAYDGAKEPNPAHVSTDQCEALLGLIGMWKMDNPPCHEEVERIIEEHRMKKYA